MEPEIKGLLTSIGIIALGNIIKNKNIRTGDYIQGIGIGSAVGTICHLIDAETNSSLPHHDITGLLIIPTTYILDKDQIIKNQELIDNLYGIGFGLMLQHLLTEGCSFCGTGYCEPGKTIC